MDPVVSRRKLNYLILQMNQQTSLIGVEASDVLMSLRPGYAAPAMAKGDFATDRVLSVADARDLIEFWPCLASSIPQPLAEVVDAVIEAVRREVGVLAERFGEGPELLNIGVYDAEATITPATAKRVFYERELMCRAIPGFEWRERRGYAGRDFAFYVPALGTVRLRDVFGDCEAHFVPARSSDLHESYLDHRSEIPLSEAAWRTKISHSLGEASEGDFAGLRPIRHGGRMYAVTGAMYGPSRSEGFAWELIPSSAWGAEPIQYKQAVHQFDSGERERGDLRGVGCKVFGELYVLSLPVLFVDERANTVRLAEMLGGEGRSNPHGDCMEDPDEAPDTEAPHIAGMAPRQAAGVPAQFALF